MNRRTCIIRAVSGLIRPGPAASGRSDPREGVVAANAEFVGAYRRGDAGAVAAMYTEQGQLFPPNEPIVAGRVAIERFWKATMDAGVKGIELKTIEVEGLGESAVEVGAYTLHRRDGVTMDRGKYLVLWKQVGGAWRLHRDCWNSSRPASR